MFNPRDEQPVFFLLPVALASATAALWCITVTRVNHHPLLFFKKMASAASLQSHIASLQATIAYLKDALLSAQQALHTLPVTTVRAADERSVASRATRQVPPLVPVNDTASVASTCTVGAADPAGCVWTDNLSRISAASSMKPVA